MDLDVTILALTAGLAGILGVLIHGLADGLLVGHLRRAHVGLHLELAQQAIHDDLQMQLTHTGDDGLTRLLVGVGAEGGILLRQLHQGDGHFLLTGLGLGLDSHADDGLRELHGLKNDGMALVAQGVAGGGVLQTHDGGDIAGIHRVDILAVVGVHLQNAAHTLALALGGVQHGGTGRQLTGVNAEEGQAAHIGVGHDLEGQGGKGLVVAGTAILFLLGLGMGTHNSGHIRGSGHIVHDGVQQLLNTLVAVRAAAGDRHHFHGAGGLADGCADLLGRDLLALQIHLHDLVIEHGHSVQQLLAVLLGQIHHILGDRLDADILTQLIVVNISIHLHQIDDTAEGILFSDGQLDGYSIGLQTIVHHVQHVEEVRAGDVHLVDVDHPGDMVVVSLTPHGLRLRLNAALGAHDGDRAVQHAQRTFHFHGKVHVARRVNDVDTRLGELVLAAFPIAGGGRRGDGNTTLLLLLHPVHGGSTLMRLTQLVIHARIVQNTFCGRGLACVDVGHDADISCIFQCNLSRHTVLLLRIIQCDAGLPAEVGECLVGFGHLVGILALLHGAAGVVGGVHDLACQALGHGALTACAGVVGQPAQTQGLTAGGTNFHGNLIGGTADTAGLDFQAGHDVFHSLGKDFQRLFLGLFLDDVKGTIHDLLSHALLAIQHDAVDQLGHQHGAVHGIGQDLSFGNITSSGHYASLLHNNMIS